MRNKKAKALRKAARTIGENTNSDIRISGYKKFQYLKDGLMKESKMTSYIFQHAQGSYRRVYKELKEHYKKLPRNARGIMVI